MPVGDIRRVSVKRLWNEALVCYSLHSRCTVSQHYYFTHSQWVWEGVDN